MIVMDKWGRNHVVNDQYDNEDIIITPPSGVTFELVPEDQLTNNNRGSTLVRENRPVTMHINPDKPQFRKVFPGVRVGTRLKNY